MVLFVNISILPILTYMCWNTGLNWVEVGRVNKSHWIEPVLSELVKMSHTHSNVYLSGGSPPTACLWSTLKKIYIYPLAWNRSTGHNSRAWL